MYDPNSDTTANARTSNLNEELGQVKFLMSDKTGTLTRNIMNFKRCTIGGTNYGVDDDQNFHDDRVEANFNNNDPNVANVYEFFLSMAACHTVVPEKDEQGGITYQASSPDEGALVKGAASQSFCFTGRTPEDITVSAVSVTFIFQCYCNSRFLLFYFSVVTL